MDRMIEVVNGVRRPKRTIGWSDVACLLYRYESTGLTPEQVAELKAENTALILDRNAWVRRAEAAVRELRDACEVHTCENCFFNGLYKCGGQRCKDLDRYHWKWRGPRDEGEEVSE